LNINIDAVLSQFLFAQFLTEMLFDFFPDKL